MAESVPRFFDWHYVWTVALEHRRELIVANAVAVAATVAAVPIPLLMPLLVDEVLLDKPGVIVETLSGWFSPDWHGPLLYIGGVLVLTLLLRVVSLALNVWQAREFTLISKDIIFRMRRAMLGRLERISMAEYETLGSGAVAAHFITDLDTIDRFVGDSVSKLLVALLSILGAAVVLLWLHWQLALFILVMNPLVVWLTMVIGRQVKRLKRKENSAFERFQGALTETLDAIHQLRACNRERHYLARLVDSAAGVRRHSSTFEWRSDAVNRLSFMTFMAGFDLFRALAMLMVVFSDLSVGQMIAVFGYLWFMVVPVQEVLRMQYALYAANAAMGRINHLLDLEEEPRYPALENPFQGRHTVGIRVEDLHFAYGEGEEVLKGIDLAIEPGEKVALVGASGGGKSTLVQVLLGLYPPGRGKIYFDNVPVERIGMERVREHVATVLQHPVLFNATLRDNLSLGQHLPESRLWHALEVAQLKNFVEALPDGLDTQVGRQGVRLSGGQRQRLAIARTVLAEPAVVVLDEATSALDTATEFAVHRAMNSFLKGRTTLIVAHRLSAVREADRVYVFEDGRISEEGSHDQLLAEKGLYAKLYGERQ